MVNRRTVKSFRSDGGGEYVGHSLEIWLNSRGIIHESTTPYSSDSNGSAERINRTWLDMAWNMS